MDAQVTRYLMEILDRVSRTEALTEALRDDLAAHAASSKRTQTEVQDVKEQVIALDSDYRGFIRIFKVGGLVIGAGAGIAGIVRLFIN